MTTQELAQHDPAHALIQTLKRASAFKDSVADQAERAQRDLSGASDAIQRDVTALKHSRAVFNELFNEKSELEAQLKNLEARMEAQKAAVDRLAGAMERSQTAYKHESTHADRLVQKHQRVAKITALRSLIEGELPELSTSAVRGLDRKLLEVLRLEEEDKDNDDQPLKEANHRLEKAEEDFDTVISQMNALSRHLNELESEIRASQLRIRQLERAEQAQAAPPHNDEPERRSTIVVEAVESSGSGSESETETGTESASNAETANAPPSSLAGSTLQGAQEGTESSSEAASIHSGSASNSEDEHERAPTSPSTKSETKPAPKPWDEPHRISQHRLWINYYEKVRQDHMKSLPRADNEEIRRLLTEAATLDRARVNAERSERAVTRLMAAGDLRMVNQCLKDVVGIFEEFGIDVERLDTSELPLASSTGDTEAHAPQRRPPTPPTRSSSSHQSRASSTARSDTRTYFFFPGSRSSSARRSRR
ncbi:hypothetical protein ACM66B_003388 [Microbotryomycetes sp. NB124-2]